MSFQKAIEDILAAHGQLERFNASQDFYMKLTNGPYEPLTIERHGDELSIEHFYIQNGDVMSDPRVTFELPTWRPTSWTLSSMGIYQENPRLSSFLLTWGRNLIDQGWKNAQVAEQEFFEEEA